MDASKSLQRHPSPVNLFDPLNLISGDEGTRTPDLLLAKEALSRLSYIPRYSFESVGLSGLEPETLPLSEARSNQLS